MKIKMIKNCPFCGSKNVKINTIYITYETHVDCMDCKAGGSLFVLPDNPKDLKKVQEQAIEQVPPKALQVTDSLFSQNASSSLSS